MAFQPQLSTEQFNDIWAIVHKTRRSSKCAKIPVNLITALLQDHSELHAKLDKRAALGEDEE